MDLEYRHSFSRHRLGILLTIDRYNFHSFLQRTSKY